MLSQDPIPAEGEWEDWAEVAAADLAEPTFQAFVSEIEADQQAWLLDEPLDEGAS